MTMPTAPELFKAAGYTLDENDCFKFHDWWIDADDVELTDDTLDDFKRHASTTWLAGEITFDDVEVLVFEYVQPIARARRQTVIIFDLGSTRAAYII